jgi:hypothetical protein
MLPVVYGSSRALRGLTVLAACLAPVLAEAGDPSRDDVAWGAPAKVVKTGAEVAVRARVRIEGHGEPAPVLPAGQPVMLRYEVQNSGKADVVLKHAGFWPNHHLVVRDAAGNEPAPSAKGKLAAAAFAPRAQRDKNAPWAVAPGKIDASEGAYDLGELYDLSKPGSYTVQVDYEEDIAFSTNRLAFRIDAAAERDATEFTAKVVAVEIVGKRRLTALRAHFDPHFVVTVHILEVSGAAPFRAGDYQAFAIHSPAKTFGGDDPMGKTYTFRLTRTAEQNQTLWHLALKD